MKKLCKYLMLCLALISMLMCMCYNASAVKDPKIIEKGNCGPFNNEIFDYSDNVTYKLYDDGKLIISGEGEMADFKWLSEFPDTPYTDYEFYNIEEFSDDFIETIIIEDGVTKIGDLAFFSLKSLNKVVIADSVTEIGEYAFSDCCTIKDMHIPDSVVTLGKNALTKDIEFVPAETYTFIEEISNGTYYEDYSTKKVYYKYDIPGFNKGDKVIVNYVDGTSDEYYFKGVNYYAFINSDRDQIDFSAFDYQSVEQPWTIGGKYNYFIGCYDRYKCTIPVEIVESDIKSISFKPVADYILYKDLSDGGYRGYGEYYEYHITFKKGDVLTVNYKNGKTKDFICTSVDYYNENVFRAADGDVIYNLQLTDNQTENNKWTVGKNYALVEYGGKDCKLTVTIKKCPVKSITATYEKTLYKGYNGEFNDYLNSYDFYKEYMNYEVVYTNGNAVNYTEQELIDAFGVTPYYSVRLKNIGENIGKVSLNEVEGRFVVNFEEHSLDLNELPDAKLTDWYSWFSYNQNIDVQLIDLDNNGFEYSITVLEIPDGLNLDQNGRLTGTFLYEEVGYYDISFVVNWEDAEVFRYFAFSVWCGNEHATLPSECETISYKEAITVTSFCEEEKWFKFRACYDWIDLVYLNSNKSSNIKIFDSNGFSIECDGYGDGGEGLTGSYYVNRGEYYYIRVIGSNKFKINPPLWLPTWSKDGSDDQSIGDLDLIETRSEQTFVDEANKLWNVYYLTGKFDVDLGYEVPTDFYGTMFRLASPVSIYTTSAATSNQDILCKVSYKYDPNNEYDCEEIGVPRDQNTMLDELLPGEIEYRMDNVYYLMPTTGNFVLEEIRYVYIPVGYVINAETSHVEKCEAHITNLSVKENERASTCTVTGSYDSVLYCEKCGLEVNRETIVVPTTEHDFSNGNCKCGVDYCSVKGHADNNADGNCDACGKVLATTEDNTPSTDCDCACHKDSIITRIFFRLKVIFWRLFRTNRECSCGVAHY